MTELQAIEILNNSTSKTAFQAYYTVGQWCAENDVDFNDIQAHYDYDELSKAVFYRSTHDMQEFFEIGYRGYDYPDYVTGYRYGNLPEGARSYNYRDNYLERGLSVVSVETGERTQDDVSLAFINRTREVVNVEGYLHPFATGSDGEPLLLAARKI